MGGLMEKTEMKDERRIRRKYRGEKRREHIALTMWNAKRR